MSFSLGPVARHSGYIISCHKALTKEQIEKLMKALENERERGCVILSGDTEIKLLRPITWGCEYCDRRNELEVNTCKGCGANKK